MEISARELFAIPDDIAYFNSASLGPPLKLASAVGKDAIDWYDERWNVRPRHWFEAPERLRTGFAELAGVAPDSVALVPSASYALATAARNVPISHGNTIVMVAEQFPSNVYAWQRRAAEAGASVVTVDKRSDRTLTEGLLGAIDTKTAVVTIPQCHWTDGELIDVDAIGAAARAVDAAFVIDASQSLGIHPLDFASAQPDFVACVGYKWLLGPYGLAYLIASERWCCEGVPIEESWMTRQGSDNFATLADYAGGYRDGARRFDAGENAQFINVPMAYTAIEQLNQWGHTTLRDAFAERAARIRTIAGRLGLDLLPEQRSVNHIVAIGMPDIATAQRLAAALADANVYAAVRGTKLRLAPHMHSTDADFERLEAALKQAL